MFTFEAVILHIEFAWRLYVLCDEWPYLPLDGIHDSQDVSMEVFYSLTLPPETHLLITRQHHTAKIVS